MSVFAVFGCLSNCFMKGRQEDIQGQTHRQTDTQTDTLADRQTHRQTKIALLR